MKNIVNTQLIKIFFNNERDRSLLAKKKKYTNLIKLYQKQIDLKDLNSGKKWDSMNFDKNTHCNNPMAHDRTKIVSKIIDYNKLNVLNIGFGPSNIEKFVLNKNFSGNWTGIDISTDSINYARKLFPKHQFLLKSILNIDLNDNKYDVVLALEVLEHISYKDIFRVLEKIYKSLTKGGYFIISVPLNENLQEMVLNGVNPNAHLRVYTKELIEAELNISRFKIIKSETLTAFHKNYLLKKFISKIFPYQFTRNNIIILAQKI